MNSRRLRAAFLASLLACALGAPPARASSGSEAGWNIGAALASVVYAPVKLGYAVTGALFGGIAWGLSGGDPGVRNAVIAPAVGGDYLVTPAHLRGARRLVFVAPAAGPGETEHADAGPWEPDTPYAEDAHPAYGDAYPAE